MCAFTTTHTHRDRRTLTPPLSLPPWAAIVGVFWLVTWLSFLLLLAALENFWGTSGFFSFTVQFFLGTFCVNSLYLQNVYQEKKMLLSQSGKWIYWGLSLSVLGFENKLQMFPLHWIWVKNSFLLKKGGGDNWKRLCVCAYSQLSHNRKFLS